LEEIKLLSGENGSLGEAKHTLTTQVSDLLLQIQEGERRLQREQSRVKVLEGQVLELRAEVSGASRQRGSAARTNSPAPSDLSSRRAVTNIPIHVTRTLPNIDFNQDNMMNLVGFEIERLEQYYMAVNQLLSETRFFYNDDGINVIELKRNLIPVFLLR
jgi:hypothetical protein